MSTCVICFGAIDHLVVLATRVYQMEFRADFEYTGNVSNIYKPDTYVYLCPKCEEILFEDASEANDFLS